MTTDLTRSLPLLHAVAVPCLEHTVSCREARIPLHQLLNRDISKVCPTGARVCHRQVLQLGSGVKRVLEHVAVSDGAGGLGLNGSCLDRARHEVGGRHWTRESGCRRSSRVTGIGSYVPYRLDTVRRVGPQIATG